MCIRRRAWTLHHPLKTEDSRQCGTLQAPRKGFKTRLWFSYQFYRPFRRKNIYSRSACNLWSRNECNERSVNSHKNWTCKTDLCSWKWTHGHLHHRGEDIAHHSITWSNYRNASNSMIDEASSKINLKALHQLTLNFSATNDKIDYIKTTKCPFARKRPTLKDKSGELRSIYRTGLQHLGLAGMALGGGHTLWSRTGASEAEILFSNGVSCT